MPPAIMAHPRLTLNVQIEVFDNADSYLDSYPSRRFSLEWPTYQIKVGRGSLSGSQELYPAKHNAWFGSRVMSRAHAVLVADHIDKTVYIEDVGSMHGTYVEERKVTPKTRERLFSGDHIKFGAEITRGSECFPPLSMCISFEWVDDSPPSIPNAPTMSHAVISRNSFSVPDYDDDEDDEIEIIHESVRVPVVEVPVPTHVYTVPESDMSNAGSFTSDDSSSEPPTPSPKTARMVLAPQERLPETPEAKSSEKMTTTQAEIPDRQKALSDAVFAEWFFSGYEQRPLAQHQALSPSKPVFGRETRPTKTDSVSAGEDAMYDEDVTESDIESVDGQDGENGYSDDLFDDDGDSIQQGSRAESPLPSVYEDSDVELVASNRGAKLGTTNHGQELRQCIADEGGHSSRHHLESQADEWPMQRPLPCNDGYRPERGPVQNASVNTSDNRAPSPSDAAMAKTSTAQLPRQVDIKTPIEAHSPFVVPLTSDFPRLSTNPSAFPRPAWPGPSGCSADPSVGWGVYEYPPVKSSRYSYQDGPFGYRPPGLSVPADNSSDRGEEESRACQLAPSDRSEILFSKPSLPVAPSRTATAQDPDSSPQVAVTTNLRATRLSINDIVDRNTQDSSGPSGEQNLKRKLDEIYTDEDAMAQALTLDSAEVLSELGLVPQPTMPTILPTSETVTSPSTDTEPLITGQAIDAVDQPARKRARTGVAKYAAAVLAGVVAGGVGTVAALLALPPIQIT